MKPTKNANQPNIVREPPSLMCSDKQELGLRNSAAAFVKRHACVLRAQLIPGDISLGFLGQPNLLARNYSQLQEAW